MSPTAGSSRLVTHSELPLPVEIRPIGSARAIRLRVDERRGILKVTCPSRMSRRSALAWAAGQRDWVISQLARIEPGEPFVPGAIIPMGGREVRLNWRADAPRTPRLNDDLLSCGGPLEGFARRIELFLKRRALETLSAETHALALKAGVSARSVAVGDADSRWGSCSSTARIRYSWRLILAPAEARRYVVAHEVAHLVHLNHGPEFKALERKLFGGDTRAARALLIRVGARLKRIGRGS
ncbi:MAG: M48 family metallopeptidase [Pseudomonadota bacterium]|nr:M48 family metallopeptidase [Pseudomonadota bacterium]